MSDESKTMVERLQHHLNIEAGEYYWHCADGRTLTLEEMHTQHCYNAFKMIYNHIGPEYDMPTVGKTVHWDPSSFLEAKEDYVYAMLMFMLEIEERRDEDPNCLGSYNQANYERILHQIFIHVIGVDDILHCVALQRLDSEEEKWFDELRSE